MSIEALEHIFDITGKKNQEEFHTLNGLTEKEYNLLGGFDTYSLVGPESHERVFELADMMVADGITAEDCLEVLKCSGENAQLKFRMAARLALSKIKFKETAEYLKKEGQSLNVDVVMNLFGEQNRIRPFLSDVEKDDLDIMWHENGENSIVKKLREIEWLVGDVDNIDIFLNVIDGGDELGSRESLNEVISAYGLEDDERLKVITMDEGSFGSSEIHPREGKHGEWQCGVRCFLGQEGYPKLAGHPNDEKVERIIMFNDTDTTFNIGQVGLELGMMVIGGDDFVYGDRKNLLSTFVKDHGRSGPGIGLYRHFQRVFGKMLFEDYKLADTQAPWKLFKKEAIGGIIDDISQWQHWGGDTGMLLAAISKKIEMAPSFVTAIDSKNESIGTHYLGRPAAWRMGVILTGVIEQVRKFLPGDTYADYENQLIELFYNYVINPYANSEQESWTGVQAILDRFDPEDGRWNDLHVKGLDDSAWGDQHTLAIKDIEYILEQIKLVCLEEKVFTVEDSVLEQRPVLAGVYA